MDSGRGCLPQKDEGRRGEMDSGRGCLPHGRKSIQELKSKLIEEKRERKSVAAALDSAERQAEGQQVLLRNAKD